jgi:hypothetical protein
VHLDALRGVVLDDVDPLLEAGQPAAHRGGAVDLHARLRDRLALLQRHEVRDLFDARLDRVGDAQQHGRALVPGPVAPGPERFARARHRLLQQLRRRARALSEHVAGGRVHDIQLFAAVSQSAADQQAEVAGRWSHRVSRISLRSDAMQRGRREPLTNAARRCVLAIPQCDGAAVLRR